MKRYGRISESDIKYFNKIANFNGTFKTEDIGTMEEILKKVVHKELSIIDFLEGVRESKIWWADGLVDVLSNKEFLGLETRVPDYVVLIKPIEMSVKLDSNVRKSYIAIKTENFYGKPYDLVSPDEIKSSTFKKEGNKILRINSFKEAQKYYLFTKSGRKHLRIHSFEGYTVLVHTKGSIYHNETLEDLFFNLNS